MADAPGASYSLADLMSDLRDGIWGELTDPDVRVNTYRRNVQRAFLDAVDRRLDPEARDDDDAPWSSDIRAVLRDELARLDELASGALDRTTDAMTRIHLRDVQAEIERIAEAN